MTDETAFRQLADTIPDNGEPSYPDRMRVRADVMAQGGVDVLLRLEERCARRGYSAWQAMFPDDNEPMDLLELALGTRDPNLARALNALNTKLDDALGIGPEAFLAAYAGFACMTAGRHAIAIAIHDQPSDKGEIDTSPLEWSPCYLTSLVEAGGATWENGTNAEARRAYWRWYLLEAVPSIT